MPVIAFACLFHFVRQCFEKEVSFRIAFKSLAQHVSVTSALAFGHLQAIKCNQGLSMSG
jgi:hypothetical protein